MLASVNWLNDYLDPPCPAEEQADLLTRAGFPLEGREEYPDLGDVCQDFEMTSNRGDCVCHLGLAREIAAISQRTLKFPQATLPGGGAAAADHITIDNREPAGCPRYTARIIRGVKVGPSPEWLANRLRACGLIPRNNLVDATNFVLFEYGQPTHVFDLSTIRGGKIIIRRAENGEPFLPIGDGATEIKLTPDDLVIADSERAIAMAGVKGGALTAVSDATTDILIEAATFDPVAVRGSSRRHTINSDSSYRFERGVHPAAIDSAAERLAALILELCGGELLDGVVEDGAPLPSARTVSMRPQRCRDLVGVDITDETMHDNLARLGFQPDQQGEQITCTVPDHRLDIEREIDLIEEVSRMYGYDHLPIADALRIRVAPPQPIVLARRAVNDALVGMGFIETVTHSLITDAAAAAFLRDGERALRVDDDRAKSEPCLRPSVVPSLLRVRATNAANGVDDLRLFEAANVFAVRNGCHTESTRLGLLADQDDPAQGLRPLRGVIERVIDMLRGPQTTVDFTHKDVPSWLSVGATVCVDDQPIGWCGVIEPKATAKFEIDHPVLAADIDVHQYFETYPPESAAHALPDQPSIQRDVSAILEESTAWAQVRDAIRGLNLDHLEQIDFVTAYRGKQIGAGRKSLTMRLRFRAADRTLTHDEVDPQMQRVMRVLTDTFDAEIRS